MVNIYEKNKSIIQTDNAGRALYVNSECLFLLDHNSLVDRTVIEEGFWELKSFTILTDLSRRLLQASSRHNIFVDCGAYFGFYTFKIFYLDLFDRIISIEANRHNYNQLCANAFLNNSPVCIELYNLAIVDYPKKTPFLVNDHISNPDNRGASRLSTPDFASSSMVSVPTSSIDELLSDVANANVVIKMDVEGLEEIVLRGSVKTLAANAVLIQVEVYEDQRVKVKTLIDILGLTIIDDNYPDIFLTNIQQLVD